MSAGKKKTIRVLIFGEHYKIRTERGREYTELCASFVDEAIQRAHIGRRVSDPHRAAILAALEITDELFQLRRDSKALVGVVEARVTELTKRLEDLAAES